jgi:hypothetical protein
MISELGSDIKSAVTFEKGAGVALSMNILSTSLFCVLRIFFALGRLCRQGREGL